MLIENNDISRTAGFGLSMFGHASFWGEGPYVGNARVLNNRLEDTGIFRGRAEDGAIVVREKSYHEQRLPHDIVIRGNTIRRTGGSGIIAKGVDRLVIEDNRISGYGWYPVQDADRAADGDGAALVVEACRDVRIADNQLVDPGPYATGGLFLRDVEGPGLPAGTAPAAGD